MIISYYRLLRKSYVSYHLMGVYGNTKLLEGMSKELKVRMQGKTCFNFKKLDEKIFLELDSLTARSTMHSEKQGFITGCVNHQKAKILCSCFFCTLIFQKLTL